jgi:hypothetical protein
MHRLLLLVTTVACAAALSACVSVPSASFAKYSRAPANVAKSGKVGFSTMVAHVSDEEAGVTQFPRTEGGLSAELAESYDLHLSSSDLRLMVEGNFWLSHSDSFGIGIIHGAGVGYVGSTRKDNAESEANDSTKLLDLTGGVIVTLAPNRDTVLHVGAKYVHSAVDSDGPDDDGSSTIGGSVGATITAGGVLITPEIIYAQLRPNEPGAEGGTDQKLDLFVFSLTLAAPY